MASFRQLGTLKTGKTQASVRLVGHNLSRVFLHKADAKYWARDVEWAISQADKRNPFDRTQFLPSTGEERQKAKEVSLVPGENWTLAQACRHYKNTLALKKKGVKSEQYRLEMWSKSVLGTHRLNELTTKHFQSFVKERLETHASDTVRREINVVRAVWRDAKSEWEIVLPDIFAMLKLVSPQAHRERRLQDGYEGQAGEQERLREALGTWKRKPGLLVDLFDFSIETGMRLSELHALTVRSVRRVRGVVSVALSDSKSGQPRYVVLSELACEIAERNCVEKMPTTKLFQISESARKRAWTYARAKAEVEDLRWHDLRHEGLSRLADQGLSFAELMSQSGHKDADSLKRYLHARPQDIARKIRQEKTPANK